MLQPGREEVPDIRNAIRQIAHHPRVRVNHNTLFRIIGVWFLNPDNTFVLLRVSSSRVRIDSAEVERPPRGTEERPKLGPRPL
jgi:hypothetical protein